MRDLECAASEPADVDSVGDATAMCVLRALVTVGVVPA